jgi:hypothetical protein
MLRRVVRRKRAATPVPSALLDANGNPVTFANRIDQIHAWCDPDRPPDESARPESEPDAT